MMHRRGISTIPTTPATQHNKHDRCMVAFQHSCMCVHIACAGQLWTSFGSINSEKDFLFSLFFFPKRIGKPRKTGYRVSPAVGGEETGGGMRPVLSYCVLPGFTIFIIIIFIISISAVLLFLNIIQMAQLAAFPPSLST